MLLILFVKYFTIGLTDSKIFYKQNQQHVTEILLYFCSKYLFDLFHCQVVCWRKVIDTLEFFESQGNHGVHVALLDCRDLQCADDLKMQTNATRDRVKPV